MVTTRVVRKTKQRGAILRVLQSTDTIRLPTGCTKRSWGMPNVSLGTIYRNLKTLVEIGEVPLSYGSGYTRYDEGPTIIILCANNAGELKTWR